MKQTIFLAALLAAVIILAACNGEQTQTSPVVSTNGSTITPAPDDRYWAKNNFDLQRVGDLVQRSRSPEEFERHLNRPGGINNLDLNGDGYVDYISVREFDDLDDPYCRGLSMYTQYGPDQIQEIGDVMFYRDDPQYPGARILLRGDPRIYGDNVYYETNWVDRSVQLVSSLFGGNRGVYSTPYYYDNYPTGYETYEVVDAPVYERRVVELYPQPVLVYTRQPEFIEKIKIRSPNDGRDYQQVHAMLVKPTREQEKFIKANPRPTHLAKAERRGKGDEARTDEGRSGRPEGEQPAKAEPQPNPERLVGRGEGKQPRAEAPKAERPKIARVDSPRPARVERPKPDRPMNPGKAAHVAKPQAVKPEPAAKPAKVSGNPRGGKQGGGGKGKKP